MKYSEQLKTKAWQDKALEIKRRDNFTCQVCKEQAKKLHAHHKTYVFDWKAWEYPNEYLITLCEYCHLEAHDWIDRINTTMEGIMINCEPLEVYRALINLKKQLGLTTDESIIKDRIIKKRTNGKKIHRY